MACGIICEQQPDCGRGTWEGAAPMVSNGRDSGAEGIKAIRPLHELMRQLQASSPFMNVQ